MKTKHRLVGRRHWHTAGFSVLLVIVMCMSLRVWAAESDRESPVRLSPDRRASEGYIVGNGDELFFRFFYTPELNTTAVVRSDGRVTLPMIGELTVVGLSLSELANRVETALSERVRRPQVTVNVQGPVASQRVFVGGEVARPGVQPLLGPLTVVQAVMAAEGLKDTAQPKNVLVLRRAADGAQRALEVNLAAVMEGRQDAHDLALSPYDVVIVPRSGIADVGLWVDQYVRRVLPISLGFSYTINRDGVVR